MGFLYLEINKMKKAKKKKRRVVSEEDVTYYENSSLIDKPLCWGHKEVYCDKSLCGKWFDSCSAFK